MEAWDSKQIYWNIQLPLCTYHKHTRLHTGAWDLKFALFRVSATLACMCLAKYYLLSPPRSGVFGNIRITKIYTIFFFFFFFLLLHLRISAVLGNWACSSLWRCIWSLHIIPPPPDLSCLFFFVCVLGLDVVLRCFYIFSTCFTQPLWLSSISRTTFIYV